MPCEGRHDIQEYEVFMNWKIVGFFIILGICTAGCVSSSLTAENGFKAAGTGASPSLNASDAAVSRNLDAYMTALTDAGRFSGTALVARGDTILLSKGYGMANQEFSVPNTVETVFPIGSNTKQLTAAAIMKLQEQGRLNLNDPVTLYLPNATGWKEIRVHQLMNHTSGIPTDGGFLATDPEDLSLEEIIPKISALPLTFKPGTNYSYSNNGYIALSAVVEQASGMPYEEYLKEHLFLPLGMNSTGQDNAREVFTNRSSGYTTMNGKYIHYDLQNIHNTWGAGAIHSTSKDMFRWVRALHTPGAVLSPESARTMFDNRYGIEKLEVANQTVTYHSGRNFGFISHTQHFSDGNVTLIFLSNYDRTPMGSLPTALSAVVYNKPYSLPQKLERKAINLTPEQIREYSGIYEPPWEKSWTFTVYPRGNRLFYDSVVPKETVELFYEGNDTFFVTPRSNDAIIFTRDAGGKVTGMDMYTLEGMVDPIRKAA
jgi:CubicO group peptidase (beta-lactamase class C family)